MENNGEINCASCGRILVMASGEDVWPWGHSHILSVAHFKKLEADSNNFSPRCQNWMGIEGCHEKLDKPDMTNIVKFRDFDKIMQYRLKHDVREYNKWITKFEELGIKTGYEYADND